MAEKRKLVTVSVTLSVLPGVSKRAAAREVRTRVNEGCCYIYDATEVRVRKVS